MDPFKYIAFSQHGAANKSPAVSSHTAKQKIKTTAPVKRLQQTKSTVEVINNPSLPKRSRKTPIRFDPAPPIEQLQEIQDEFTKVRRQIAQRIIEIDDQDDEQNELEDNSDNVQDIELLLEEENQQTNNEMIANKQQRTSSQPSLFSDYQKQMTEFLQQSKQREEESKQREELKRQLELIQTRLEETEQKLAIEQFRRDQIEQQTNRINNTNSIVFDPAPPKFTTPSFSGILEEDKIDYDTWVQYSRRYLSCWNVPDSHKITATLMNIKSPAIEILQPYEKNFKSVEDIYAILKTQFQVSDKFKKLDNLKQIGSGEESIQLLAVKIQALVDSVCTKETRESRALKYFVNALRPDVFIRVGQLCPVNFENVIIQAKMIEKDLAIAASKKD